MIIDTHANLTDDWLQNICRQHIIFVWQDTLTFYDDLVNDIGIKALVRAARLHDVVATLPICIDCKDI